MFRSVGRPALIACCPRPKEEVVEFLVEFHLDVPEETPESEVEQGLTAEAAASEELAGVGHLVRLWRPPVAPGERKTVGLYRADDQSQLDVLLGALPFSDRMRITVTPLEPHPDDPTGTSTRIERALDLAGTDGLLLPFVLMDLRELLEQHRRDPTADDALLTDVLDVIAGSGPQRRAEPDPSCDPLTKSELRVLRFLPSHLSASEIGAELYLSLNTIRTHLRHIYTKLGVHTRTEVVDRARELGLLVPVALRH
jgi:muconolactone delta-isomerase